LAVALLAVLRPEDPGWLQVAPHPLLFLTMVLSARHGAPAALISGLLSAAVHVAFQLMAARGAPPPYDLGLTMPALMVLTGATRGTVVTPGLKAARALLLSQRSLERTAHDLQARLERSDLVRARLERRSLEPAQSVALLHEAALRMESLEESELGEAVLDLLVAQLQVERAEVLVLEGTDLRPIATLPATEGPSGSKRPRGLRPPSGLLSLALDERRVTSARDAARSTPGELPGDETGRFQAFVPSTEPLPVAIAAPLLAPTGRPLGIVSIEKLPFENLTGAACRIAGMVADWAARSLERARALQGLRTYDPETGAATYAHTLERLAHEFARAYRYKDSLSILILTARSEGRLTPERQGLLRRTLAQILRSGLRNVDLIGCHKDRLGFVALLPSTAADGAAVCQERLTQELARFELQAHTGQGEIEFQVAVATRSPEMVSAPDLLNAAEQALAAETAT
jgi:GGDEF domain-containing protein